MNSSSARMIASASGNISRMDAYTPVDLDISCELHESRSVGATISCQLPNSFLAKNISPSQTLILQNSDETSEGYVEVEIRSRGKAPTSIIPIIRPREFYSGCDVVRHGQCVDARCESLNSADLVIFHFRNMRAPWVANQIEHIYVAVDGTQVMPAPVIEVMPREAVQVRLIAPSRALPGAAFKLKLVTLDEFHNVSKSSYAGVDIGVYGGSKVVKDVAFVGRCEVEITLHEPGTYRFAALGVVSNPVKVSENSQKMLWGDLHSHSDMSVDAVGHDNYNYAREVSALDFCAVCDHGAVTHPVNWERAKKRAVEADSPGEFVPILAYELNLGFHYNIYFPDLEGEMLHVRKPGDSTADRERVDDLMSRYPGVLGQLHHTGIQFGVTDMTQKFPPNTSLIEIFSHHGQSECYNPDHILAYENIRNHPPDSASMISMKGPFYGRDAWAQGKALSAVGSSDDHFSQPGKCQSSLTAVMADECGRSAIFDALARGNCYATTGERIIVDFHVNETPMGGTVQVKDPEQILMFELEVHGTWFLQHVEVLRYRFDCPERGWEAIWEKHYEFRWNLKQSGGVLDLNAEWQENFAGSALYYARVRQFKPSQSTRIPAYAWTSPIGVCGRDACLPEARRRQGARPSRNHDKTLTL